MTTWITNWAGGSSGSSAGTQIQLTAAAGSHRRVRPRCSRRIPTLFSSTVYPVVEQWCSRCHSDTAASPQSPYFASATLATAYAAAQPYMDLNTPTNSMFYIRLAQQSHNCWGNPISCPNSAATMLAAIQALRRPDHRDADRSDVDRLEGLDADAGHGRLRAKVAMTRTTLPSGSSRKAAG